MKTGRWLGLLCAVGVGFVVVSCDEEVPTAPEEVTTPTTTGAASNPADASPATPLFDSHFGSIDGDCLNELPDGTERFNNATCTANDVEIKVLEALAVDFGSGPEPIPPGGTVTCVEGTTFDVTLRAYFGFNREETYDIAYFLAQDGGDAKVGDCFHDFLQPIDDGGAGTPTSGPPFNGPYRDAEHGTDPTDVCGDAQENDEIDVPGIADGIGAIKDVPETITITCADDDDDGFVEIGTCTSWDINASNGGNKPTCEGVEDAFPGTPSKCNCRPAPLPINIQRSATVKVIKDVEPEPDDGSLWTLTIASPSLTSDVTDNKGDGGFIETTIEWYRDDEPGANKATVTEAYHSLGAGSDDFYTSTYSCNSTNDAHDIASTSGRSIPEFTDLVNNESIVCTFVNTRIAPPAVTVTKTANESFDRAWSWQLAKTVYKNGAVSPAEVCSTLDVNIEDATLPLQLGQLYTACYVVTATPGGPTDSNHLVTGTINVSVAASTAPYTGNFTITDQLDPGDVNAVVDCDGTAGSPFDNTKSSVPQGGSFSCTYSASLTAAQAAALTTDTATASVSWNTGDSGTHKGNAASSFSGVTPTNESDETADVTDTWYNQANFNLQLAVPASGGVATWTFARNLQCPDYGDTLIPNDAYLDSNDGGYDLEDDADVTASCPPPPSGCTLTQGYWRTHSQFGPAPYSDNWEVITPNGADTEFSEGFDGVINSDMTYYQVLWDPGKGGNAWFKLGHQYIAAQLNILNGADPSLVSTWMADAQSILNYYDQDASGKKNSIPKRGDAWCQTDGGACTGYNSDRQYAMYLNNKLTQYNEGTLPGGPLHCDDDAQSFYGSNVE